MVAAISIFDIFTLIRIPAIICQLSSNRGLRCFYKFRVLTFYLFLLGLLGSFGYCLWQVFKEQMAGGFAVLLGILGGTFLVIDHYFNQVLKNYLHRQLRRDQIHMAKIKGR